MGAKTDAGGGRVHPLFTRHPAYRPRQKNRGARGGDHHPAGWKMAKIILAEDANDMRRFLVKALQNTGYDMISFGYCLSAYQLARSDRFEALSAAVVITEMDR